MNEELTIVGRYAQAQEGMERVLVILALGVPCWLYPAGDGFDLMVETSSAENARLQLERYEAERLNWPPAPRAEPDIPPLSPIARITALLWALLTIGVFWLQNRFPGRLEAAGDLQAGALFRHGQWWRPFTALFLHASAAHLLANLGSGYFAFCATLAVFGLVRGWLLIAAAGTLGNVVAAALHAGSGVESLGASTAIFAALGLLTGRAARTARNWVAPFGAGAALLALYGTGGGAEVDLGAHLGGFAAGLALGYAVVAGNLRRST